MGSTPPPLVEELLARCSFPVPQTAVFCAVSGGADSLALLVLACASGCRVTAMHVDHGLRPGSAREAGAVKAACDRFGAVFVSHRVAVAPGSNLEARARRARYGVLPTGVMTGHTADDRAETMLLNLLRGSGAAGLAALGPSPRRPLLALRRGETVALCGQLGLEALQDPSNSDPRFRRNRVRNELLPLLAAIAERDVVPLLTRLGGHLDELDQLVGALARELDACRVADLVGAPPAVAAQALRSWLRQHSDAELHPPDAATVARVLAVARGQARATEIGGGRRVSRRGGRLVLE